MSATPEMMHKPLIWVEGIIGAGKTKFAKEIGGRLGLRVLEEPVDSNPYLELFYKMEPEKFAFAMQVWLLHERAALQNLAAWECTGVGGYDGAVLDRSISGDRVFAKLQTRKGNITPLDWRTYERAYSIIARTLLPPTLIVFLDAQPQVAFERMKGRGRGAESTVQVEYLEELRAGYRELLGEATAGLLPWSHAVRIVTIPWDVDTATDSQWGHTAETIKDECGMFQSVIDNAHGRHL